MLPSPRVGGALSGALMWSIADAGAGVKREGVPGSRRGRSRENSSYDQLYSNAAPVRASPEGHSNRSEERRVGKECRSRRWPESQKKKVDEQETGAGR